MDTEFLKNQPLSLALFSLVTILIGSRTESLLQMSDVRTTY